MYLFCDSTRHGLYTTIDSIACEMQQYVNIVIESDSTPETSESFFVILEGTRGLDIRITLDPVEAEIEISDSSSKKH